MNKIPTYSFYSIGRKEKLVDIFKWTDPNPYHFETPHCHDYHEIMIFYKGGGMHDINFVNYPVESNSIHIIPKSYLHQLNRSTHSTGFTIAITDLFIEQLLKFEPTTDYSKLFNQENVVKLAKKEISDFSFYFTEIVNSIDNEAMLQNLSAAILIKLGRLLLNNQTTYSSFNKIVQTLLGEHYLNRLSTKQYADLLSMSAINLNLKLKKSTGKTIMQLQNEMLVSKIKHEIYSTDLTFKEIAFHFGFDDYAHFSKFFKLNSGYSPTDYKGLFKKIQAFDKNRQHLG